MNGLDSGIHCLEWIIVGLTMEREIKELTNKDEYVSALTIDATHNEVRCSLDEAYNQKAVEAHSRSIGLLRSLLMSALAFDSDGCVQAIFRSS
jgi:hypothetical protein